MKKLPLGPSIIVALVVLTCIGLGFWQLQRKAAKEALLVSYAEALAKPPIAFPAQPSEQDKATYLFRHATGYCALVMGWSAEAGGSAGVWKHVAACFTGDPGAQPMQVDVGASAVKDDPQWQGGQVEGVITRDQNHVLRMVAAQPAPRLQVTPPPTADDLDNPYVGGYWLFWFSMAPIAIVIYALALRRRSR
jgi:surfeit locus 1 family protein